MTATAEATPTAKTATAPPAAGERAVEVAPDIALDFLAYATDRFIVEPFTPGSFIPSGPRVMPDQARQVPCLSLSWRLLQPTVYDATRANIVRGMVSKFDALRRAFVNSAEWCAVEALEGRLADIAADQRAAEQRAKDEAVKIRAAIVSGNLAAENAAAAQHKIAEAAAAAAANRHKIVGQELPNVRAAAMAALRSILEQERAKLFAAAEAEARRLAAEITEAVAELVGRLVAANVAAGVASDKPGASHAYNGPSDGLVGAFARLPH